MAECDFKFGMICITETWCSNDSFQNNSNFNLTNYRAIHLGRKEKRGGGVCVFVHEQYRKLPIISGALTFEISSPMRRLFSGAPTFGGGAYYRVV